MHELHAWIETLAQTGALAPEGLRALLLDARASEPLAEKARAVRESVYGKDVFVRGLIEISSFCKNDCYYCGIRRSNLKAERYRLSKEEILACCAEGYAAGLRTFVLQGGEDAYFTPQRLVEIVAEIHAQYPDCAITLSVGEHSRQTYQMWFDAGATRYLLRHETATPAHYAKLHPASMSLAARMDCLHTLRDIGFQTGCGMMIGSPEQTVDDLARDLAFIADFKPQMIGIGPFIPHCDTPFADYPHGSVELTLRVLSIVRLLQPHALIPATTALGSLEDNGRERGILAGANVVMPNLSPPSVRAKYSLYNNKLSGGCEAAENLKALSRSMDAIGYRLALVRGDFRP